MSTCRYVFILHVTTVSAEIWLSGKFGTNPLIPTYKTGELKWMPHIYADVDILQGRLLLWLVCSPPKIGNMDPFPISHHNCAWFAALQGTKNRDPFPISHHNCDWFAALQGIGNMDPFPLEDSTRDTDVSIYDYSFATSPRNRNYVSPSPWNDSLWKVYT